MSRRTWSHMQPTTIGAAMETCLLYARERHNLSVDRVADRMGANKWSIYKWTANGRMPTALIRPFEHACQSPAWLTKHLCHGAHLLAVPIPTGRRIQPARINELQAACARSIELLAELPSGLMTPAAVVTQLTTTMEMIAAIRAAVQHEETELPLGYTTGDTDDN